MLLCWCPIHHSLEVILVLHVPVLLCYSFAEQPPPSSPLDCPAMVRALICGRPHSWGWFFLFSWVAGVLCYLCCWGNIELWHWNGPWPSIAHLPFFCWKNVDGGRGDGGREKNPNLDLDSFFLWKDIVLNKAEEERKSSSWGLSRGDTDLGGTCSCQGFVSSAKCKDCPFGTSWELQSFLLHKFTFLEQKLSQEKEWQQTGKKKSSFLLWAIRKHLSLFIMTSWRNISYNNVMEIGI